MSVASQEKGATVYLHSEQSQPSRCLLRVGAGAQQTMKDQLDVITTENNKCIAALAKAHLEREAALAARCLEL